MPFSTCDVDAYTNRHCLPAGASDYIRRAAINVSRDVGQSGYACVVTEFPSLKMGTSIVTESRRGELAFAILSEYDENVLAYYEQPPAVDCRRTSRKGICATRVYRPDFLVLSNIGPSVVQIKTEQALQELVVSQAGDWVLRDGIYRDLPAEAALQAFDLNHRVVSTAALPPIQITNIRLLLRVRQTFKPATAHPSIETVRALFKRRAMMSLAALAEQLRILDVTPLLHFIDAGQLHALLDKQLITDPKSCQVALLPELLAFERARLSEAGNVSASTTLDWCPPQKQAEQGLRNMQRFQQGSAPPRTKSEYRLRIKSAQADGLSIFQALTPKTHRSGNWMRKRPAVVIDHAERTVKLFVSSNKRPSIASVYRQYLGSVDSELPDTRPLSRNAVVRLIKLMGGSTEYGRGGRRAANAAAFPTPVQERVVRPNRPLELATADHYLVDVECVLTRSAGKTYTRRAWLTVLRDIHTGVMLSMWLGFRAPSRICCAMVLRGCVRRHGRLPEGIVVDRGAEFRSVYFSALLAHHGVAAVFRPTSHPRYGAEAERFFGQFKSQWLDLRPGNTTSPSEGRAVSGSHKATLTAELELPDLLTELWSFCDWQNSYPGPTQALPPSLLFHEGMTLFPSSGIPTELDAAFILSSAVDETRIKLDPARGLKVGAMYYSNPLLADPNLRASRIEVRREPEDESIVYARIGNEWITCHSSSHPSAVGKSLLARTASAVLALDGANVRAEMERDAAIDIVRRMQKSDADFAARQAEQLARRELPSPAIEAQYVDDEDLKPLTTTRWEKP